MRGIYVSQIGALTVQLQQAQLELREAMNRRDELQRQLVGEEPVLLPQMPSQSGVAVPELDGRIDTLRRSLDELLLRYTDKHPDVTGTRRLIEELEVQKRTQVEAMQASGGSAVRRTGCQPLLPADEAGARPG